MSDPWRDLGPAPPRTYWTPAEALVGEPRARTSFRPTKAGLRAALTWPRVLLLAPLAAAIVGVAFFFGPDLFSEELGIALICLGVGVLIIAGGALSIRDSIDVAQGSTPGALLFLVFLGPRAILRTVVGLVVAGFGLLMLAIAIGVI